MNKIYIFLLSTMVLLSCKDENRAAASVDAKTTDDLITTEIALANGYGNFEEVEKLSFTFNVKTNDTLRSQRAWTWYPQEDRVELIENGQTLSYLNDGDFNEEEQALDQKFINDTYWLLFPFHLVWSDYEFSQDRSAAAPISGDPMKQLTISYTNDGGYTPGDTYHLFLDDEDSIIKEWTYESSSGRTLSTTWEDYETFNGITISKMRRNADNSFQLYFTDIEVVKKEE